MVFLGGRSGGGAGKIFGQGIFLSFNGSPRNFLGFDICSHSIIPEALSTSPRLGSHFPRWRTVRRSRYVILPW